MKKIIDIKEDDLYTVIEYEDHKLKIFISIEQLENIIKYLIKMPNKKECICCKRDNVSLCLLDDEKYICLDCTTKIIEIFGRNGEKINININNISHKMAKQMKDFIEGNIKSDKVIYKIKGEENDDKQ